MIHLNALPHENTSTPRSHRKWARSPSYLAISLSAALTLACLSTAAEVLPNGIALPEVWPPRGGDPASRAPMPVPYLQVPPEVIPIDVGRQLFVDDFLVQQSDLTRTFHQPKKHSGNPVLVPSTTAELQRTRGNEGEQEAVSYLGHGGVFFDPTVAQFKMWYTAGWRGGLAFATSKDAVTWSKPELGLAGDNLLLAAGGESAGKDNSVWLDLDAADPALRLKFMTQRPGKHTLHVSTDGRAWSRGVSAGTAADYCSFFYNPFRSVWAFSIKRNGPHGRTRHYAESRDFLTDGIFDRSVFWVGADELDRPDSRIGDPTQLYSLNAVAYESLMIGMFYIHLGPKNSICELGRFPKMTELKIGFSRDGFHWYRPDRRAFIAPTGRDGDWDRGYIHGTTGVCLVVGDQLIFPYTGYSGVTPGGHRGMYTGASIGLAVLRRDGFASLDAIGDAGTITTRLVKFSGHHLFVNAAVAGGALQVEVLDEKGDVLPGFGKAESSIVSEDRTLMPVTWGERQLGELRGRAVRFRFHLTRGSLYSFWVSQDKSGASHGYVAAGGPGYLGSVDNVGAPAQLR